jgi:Flp pilus assembly pilin Flp
MDDTKQSLVRHLLTGLGSAAVTYGLIDAATATSLVGALSIVIGVAWSQYDKRSAKP